jgi:prepilin-type N-terminal cleavage/methylation domain-containing protein
MSLIELLVVISIIGVLAGLILPAVGNVKKKAKIVQAQKDMADLKGSISVYQNDYSRLPASSAAAGVGSDFTYGTTGTGYGTNIYNNNNVGYQAGNAELMVMLTAGTFPGYTPHASIQNNAKNPRRNPYFNAKSSAATSGPGLGTDGVMRDPWGSPYIIALDLNYDGWVSNSVYRLDVLNTFNTGLVRVGPAGPPGANTWALKDSAMIFSFGPDGMLDANAAAGTEPNKDNVLSWK